MVFREFRGGGLSFWGQNVFFKGGHCCGGASRSCLLPQRITIWSWWISKIWGRPYLNMFSFWLVLMSPLVLNNLKYIYEHTGIIGHLTWRAHNAIYWRIVQFWGFPRLLGLPFEWRQRSFHIWVFSYWNSLVLYRDEICIMYPVTWYFLIIVYHCNLLNHFV